MFALSKFTQSISCESYASQIGHFFFPRSQIGLLKLREAVVTTGTREYLDEFHRCSEEVVQACCTRLDVHSFPELRFLGGDSGRTIVRVADACGDAADRLHRTIRESDAVCAERECFHEIGRGTKSAGDD